MNLRMEFDFGVGPACFIYMFIHVKSSYIVYGRLCVGLSDALHLA